MVKNILILNMTRMGDLIQSTPTITGLRKKYRDSNITLMVTKDFEEFSKNISHVNNRVVIDIKQFRDRKNLNGFLWIELYRYLESLLDELKKNNYDLLINLSHSKLSAFMISYLGINSVRGFGCNKNGDRMTFDPWMQYFGTEPFNRKTNPFNLVEIFTRGAGVAPENNPIHLIPNSIDPKVLIQKFGNCIKEGDLVIGMQAGSSIEGRRWSPKSFAILADDLIESLGARLILFGVDSEKELGKQIVHFSKYKDKLIDLTGRTNVDELTSLVKRCSYLITNDTGTMHIAAAVGTTVVGLFFAHAHPYETAPYSPGHVIFQARIECAPCSYGVECNNIVCVHKVQPDHLLLMIQSHYANGVWEITKSMPNMDEINIFNTYIGEDRRLRLRSLIKHPITLNDIIREVYAEHWLNSLGQEMNGTKTNCDIGTLLFREYDCSNTDKLYMQIKDKIATLKSLEGIASLGIKLTNKIINICASGKFTKIIDTVKLLAEEVEKLDKRISQIGFVNPELKSITDMFVKRKENIQENEPTQLALDTKRCYLKLLEECDSLIKLLMPVFNKFKSHNVDTFHAAVSSINVEVPGR
jgi:ADP-heptose:LPS heptosyltransferase/ribosomal protein S13